MKYQESPRNPYKNVKGAIISASPKQIQSNLPSDEKEALENLITLQKKGLIVVTRTDKTGGFAIVDRTDYVNSMNMVLQNKIVNEMGVEINCYKEINMEEVKRHHLVMVQLAKKGL